MTAGRRFLATATLLVAVSACSASTDLHAESDAAPGPDTPSTTDGGSDGSGLGVGALDSAIPGTKLPTSDAAPSQPDDDAATSNAAPDGASSGPECLWRAAPCVESDQCCQGLSCDTTYLGRICCGEEGTPCFTENGEDCCRDLLCIDGACGYPSTLSSDTCQPSCLPMHWLADVLRAAGLEVWEDPNWRHHGHGSFANLWGVMAHHTGVNRDTEWMVVRDGVSGLAGPLSQLVLEQNGMYRVVASGVAWHAGTGFYPGLPDNNANFHTVGIEAVNTGSEGWSTEQYDAYVLGVAAILRYLQHDASRVIAHKEWAGITQGKWDPGGIDMDVFRADVQAILNQ